MEQKTVGELEAAILNGDTTVTPERLIAAKRIAELTAERDAELAQAKKAKDEQVEREKTERAEEARQKAERIADIERQFVDGNNLTCQELVALKEHLARQSDRARLDVERYKIEPEHRIHLTPRELATRERELKTAHANAASIASLYTQVSNILRTMPNSEKREYLADLKKQIAVLEQREKTLLVYRAEDHRQFYVAGGDHVELDGIGKELYALRNELKAADKRDRSSEGSLRNFEAGIKGLVKAWRNGEIALHDVEIFVREVIGQCGCHAPLGLLYWSKASFPYRSPVDQFDDINSELNEAREMVSLGTEDHLAANSHIPGFDPGIVFQSAIERIFKTGVPEINFKVERWWRKIDGRTEKNAAERLRF